MSSNVQKNKWNSNILFQLLIINTLSAHQSNISDSYIQSDDNSSKYRFFGFSRPSEFYLMKEKQAYTLIEAVKKRVVPKPISQAASVHFNSAK